MSYQTEEQLPFFVYGTLRPGQSNFYLLGGKTRRIQSGWVSGFALYSLGSYPSLLYDDDARSRVYGEVITPRPYRYQSVLQTLDHLEEYDPANPDESWYLRIPHTVHLNSGKTLRAWLYMGRAQHLKPWHNRIRDGDWVRYWQQNGMQPFTGRNAD